MIDLLLKSGAEIDSILNFLETSPREDEDGLGTALHEAAEGGQEEAVAYLLEQGTDLTIKNLLGKTVLEVVQEKGQISVVDVLQR